MKLLVGLGNPGREYVNTRHNIGFLCLDELARRHGATFDTVRMRALTATFSVAEPVAEKIVLVKPQTFMNASGEATAALASWHKITPGDIIVVTDDLDLPFGRLRLRLKGSAGGHNGLRSIIERLGTEEFARLRIGIGRPPGHKAGRDYVLDRFSTEEAAELPFVLAEAADALGLALEAGFAAAMNRYNLARDERTGAQGGPKTANEGRPREAPAPGTITTETRSAP